VMLPTMLSGMAAGMWAGMAAPMSGMQAARGLEVGGLIGIGAFAFTYFANAALRGRVDRWTS